MITQGQKKRLYIEYKKLLRKHGRPQAQWGLWCKRRKTAEEKEVIIIGAILTQRTNWRNVEAAIKRLQIERAGRLAGVYKLAVHNPSRLASLIRACGFYKNKIKCLKAAAGFFIKGGGVTAMSRRPAAELRRDLLALPGIGPETADSILLYALHKQTFVIDEYTRRFVKQKRLAVQSFSYDQLQRFFMKQLPKNFRLYQDFHALIVVDGKQNSNNS